MSTLTRLAQPGPVRTWVGIGLAAVLLLAVAPALMSDFRLGLLAKYLCLAMVAVGIGLAWGRGGMLTLGQGVYFGLGAYIMAMHLKLSDAGPGGVPDFMLLYGDGTVPGWWEPMRSPAITLAFIIIIPGLLAAGLGLAVFRRRVRGAYFAILSQALAGAFAIFLIGQQTTTGGTNGLNGFRSFFGYDLNDPINKRMLYFIAAIVLIAMVVLVRQLMQSRFGELLVAVRDQENRVRFLGYDPALTKTTAYVIAAIFAAIGGALFVPIVGIISPADVGVVPSIAFIIGVAIGGRATLLGPVVGSIAVSWAQTSLSESFPSFWTYFQGALFILVIAFVPGGIASLGGEVRKIRARFGGGPSGDGPSRGGTSPSDSALPEGAADDGAPTDAERAGVLNRVSTADDGAGARAVGRVAPTDPRPAGEGSTT